ncbi:hypothetical protein HG531_006605 [Fusarium graminearum]|nr:hypothetical protein HG531_006605 [Fusarium graminearum]
MAGKVAPFEQIDIDVQLFEILQDWACPLLSRAITRASVGVEVTDDYVFKVAEVSESFCKHVPMIACAQQGELTVVQLNLPDGSRVVAIDLKGMGEAIKSKMHLPKIAADTSVL